MANVTKPPILDNTGKAIKNKLTEILEALQGAGANFIPTSQKGSAGGVATLDSNSKLTSAQKPTYIASEVGALADSTTYAGASTAGGAASSAEKLTNTSSIGAVNNPVYFTDTGVPAACTYELNKSVPSDAVFTDTTYESKTAASAGTDVSLVTTGEKYTWNNKSNFSGSYNDLNDKPTIPTVSDTYDGISSNAMSGKAVKSAIDSLPNPMVFRGSLGTGGTITALPVDGTATIGDTYKVITDGTYASQAAKVGDTFVCLTKTSSENTWELIPSGDEPSGTVTNVATGTGLSGGPITSTGTISHADTSSQASVSNSGRTYIQSITLDGMGHVTALSSATETVTNTDRYVNSASFAHDSTNNNVKMTLTRAGSDTATVVGNIPKVSSSSAGVAPKGASVSSQTQSTKFLREDGSWAAPSYTTNTNTTYTFANGTNGFTVTPSGGSAQTVTVTPSITNNVTGSGTSGYLAKFNGANTITNGPAIGSDTTKYLRNDGTWVKPPNDNTWTALVGATSSANGSVGYINATPPKDGYNTKFFRADGSWAVPGWSGGTVSSNITPNADVSLNLGVANTLFSGVYSQDLVLGRKSSKTGSIYFYQSTDAYYGRLMLNGSISKSNNQTYYLPNVGGTLARVEDLKPTVYSPATNVGMIKVGKMVIFSAYGWSVSSYSNAWTNFITDAAYKPASAITFLGVIYVAENNNYIATCDISAEGKTWVRFKNTINTRSGGIGTNWTFWGTGCWFTS